MTDSISGWYLEGIDYAEAPTSIEELTRRFPPAVITKRELLTTAKWEHLLRGDRVDLPAGWVHVSDLAATRRGIATGSNNFFLLSELQVMQLGISPHSVKPCVGRANDVRNLIFTAADFEALRLANVRCQLVDFQGPLTPAELEYVRSGREAGLTARYLLAARSPWYSMEQREVSPVWASVFGRGDLEFVFNAAGCRSLTNFNCIYPKRSGETFTKALVLCLNSRPVRERSRLHTRGYGGGLTKFEPNDLRGIPLPDLRALSVETLEALADCLDRLDQLHRAGADDADLVSAAAHLVLRAGDEAAERIGGRSLL